MRRLPPDQPFDTRRFRMWLRTFFAAILLFAALSIVVGLYVDNLWFDSLGFGSVFWYGVKAQFTIFLVSFAATAGVLFAIFRVLIGVAGSSRRLFVEVQGRLLETPSAEGIKRLARWIAVVVALIVAAGLSSQWVVFARYFNRPESGGDLDPIFGRSVIFYFFTLPIVELGSGWLFLISIVSVTAALVLFGIGMSVRFRGPTLAGSLLLISMAVRTFLGRYELLFADHSLFSGVRYVDHTVYAFSMLATSVVLLLGAGVLAFNVAKTIRSIVAILSIPAGVYIVGGILIPWYVTTFIVRPNELVRETPYIRHNITATRKGFGLQSVEVSAFEPRQTNAIFNPAPHETTLSNMRLWDWKALQDTLRQIQEIRTYYDFPDVDIDRYVVNGKPISTMLATREIDIDKLPVGSRNWVNDRLIYTHGYGVTMSSATRFTQEGLPDFLLSNMPVNGPVPEIQVKRPEIYFGELTNWPVYVKTRQKEFNYPEGEGNNSSTYEGTGGVRMGSLLRRLLLAFEVGDLTTVPFSNDVGADSVLLHYRNIIERVSRLAPFLTLDDDPYMVVGDDGALYWMLDGYTTSDRYPYSRHLDIGRRSMNYIRNSVKAVVDAYNGNVSFYIFDDSDPLITAYQKMFPDLFLAKSKMPEFLMRHIRYPELLFEAQAMVYSTYHVDNEQVFYNREDVWSIAQQSRAQGGAQAADRIEPAFILMTFPGESRLEFLSILPFTPSNRNNMIGWLAGRSDGEAYGKLRAYHLPKTKFVDGPLQIQAKIDQDPQLSSQLTLWNQQGSKVIRGTLLVLPIDDVLLFAEPIYLQAERSPMPALRLIVLATQDRLAYAPTFDEALKLLLENRGGSLTQSSSTERTPSAAAENGRGTSVPVDALINRANQALTDYRRLTSEGKLAEAGAKLDELKNALEELNRSRGAGR